MKNPNPSNKKIKSEKKRPSDTTRVWLEEYLDCFTFKMQPVTEMFLKRIAKELLEWAQNDKKALRLSQFYNSKKIPRKTFEGWYKYDYFKEAKDMALLFIADRREIGTLEKRYEAGTNNFMMPEYDPSWKSMVQWRQELRNQAQGKNTGSVNVYLEQYPSSDMVPERKKTESKTPEEVAAHATKNTRIGHGIDN